MVIVMIAITSALLMSLTESTYVSMQLNQAAVRRVQAEYLLKSAINYAALLIQNDRTGGSDPFQDEWTDYRSGPPFDTGRIGIALPPGVTIQLQISSAEDRIPIYQMRNPLPTSLQWANVLVELFRIQGIDQQLPSDTEPPKTAEQLVANLIDYLDRDRNSTNFQNFQGEESDSSLADRFLNRGAMYDLEGELASIPGFNGERVSLLNSFIGWVEGQSSVNVNFVKQIVLQAMLQGLDLVPAGDAPSLAQQIIDCRGAQPQGVFTSSFSAEISGCLTGVGFPISNTLAKLTANTSRFSVLSKVSYGQNSSFMAEAIVTKAARGAGAGPPIRQLLIY
jgi:type II secretory pathway component PulK